MASTGAAVGGAGARVSASDDSDGIEAGEHAATRVASAGSVESAAMVPRASMAALDRRVKRRGRHAIASYLRSIVRDAAFVASVRAAYPDFPCLANLRNGLWYAPGFDGTAYFKSTDGHTGEWNFPTTRLNLHVARLAQRCRGTVLVDSTRKGKRFPDSLSKTVPIWCAVINRVCQKSASDECSRAGHAERAHDAPPRVSGTDRITVDLPPWVSPSEADQINSKLPAFEASIDSSLRAAMLAELGRGRRETTSAAPGESCSGGRVPFPPLRPVWVCPSSRDEPMAFMPTRAAASSPEKSGEWDTLLPVFDTDGDGTDADADDEAFTPVVCVSASRHVSEDEQRERHSWTYIQGAGDDEESWARGLTAELFWRHRDALLEEGLTDYETEERVDRLVGKEVEPTSSVHATGGAGGEVDRGHGSAYMVVPSSVVEVGSSGLLLATRDAIHRASWEHLSPEFIIDLTSDGVVAEAGLGVDSALPGVATCHVPLSGGGKRAFTRDGERELWYSAVLPRSLSVAARWLRARPDGSDTDHCKLLICCETDLAEGVAVAAAVIVAFLDVGKGLTPLSWVVEWLASPTVDLSVPNEPNKAEIRRAAAVVQLYAPTATLPRRLLKELTKFFSSRTAHALGYGGWAALVDAGCTVDSEGDEESEDDHAGPQPSLEA